MKKLSTLLAVLLVSTNVMANENTSVMSNMTLAAVETSTAPSWSAQKSETVAEKRMEIDLEEKTQVLNDKINAQLEKSLEEKLNRELKF
jgi:hypothetical protein